MKYILFAILAFIAAAFIYAIVVRFKWFFITIGILAVIAFVAYCIIKWRKKSALQSVDSIETDEKHVLKNDNTATGEKPVLPESRILTYAVKGVFSHEDDIFHNLMQYNPEYDYTKQELIDNCIPDYPIYKWIQKDLTASLLPEPDNAYDPNAIRVMVGDILIGYIPKESCLGVLDIINSGRLQNVAYEITGGSFKLLEEDYDPEKDRSKYTVKTGRGELSATVYIKERL